MDIPVYNPPNRPHAGVLLIGADFQALGVARALAEQKIPFALLETETGIARYSRNVTKRFVKHDLLTAEDSIDFMLELASSIPLKIGVFSVSTTKPLSFSLRIMMSCPLSIDWQ